MHLKQQAEQMSRRQIASKMLQLIRSSKLLSHLFFTLWILPIIIGVSTSQNMSKRNVGTKSFIHNALSRNYTITTTTRSLQEPSNFPCQPWCVNNLTPWRDPDPTVSQKCNWPNSCKGCPQCDPDFESSEPSPSPTKACLKWCDNHADPWTTKCRWPLSCGGCSQCAESPFIPSPSSLSLRPTESTNVPTLVIKKTLNPTMTPTIRTRIPTYNFIENFNSIFFRTKAPTVIPSVSPSSKLLQLPSESPTLSATLISTKNRSTNFSISPTEESSNHPIYEDRPEPSITPTISSNLSGTHQPSSLSFFQSLNPTLYQSQHSSSTHTSFPSILPSYSPSSAPTSKHSFLPTVSTSTYPSRKNSEKPSITPSILSSNSPSNHLSSSPTLARSMNPTSYSSQTPSLPLSDYPSAIPSQYITRNPSFRPTKRITSKPTGEPTETPSFNPTTSPLGILSNIPSTDTPSLNPIVKKTNKPISHPTMNSTLNPIEKPTSNPSLNPSQNMITMKLENATFYVNLRSKIEMDERTKKVFQETTKDFLDELDIGTDDINISFIDVVIDSQYQTISNTNERLQILTEKSTVSMIIQNDLELLTHSKGDNNVRHLQNFSAYLLVNIIIVGIITSSHNKINEYNFNDAVFNAMNQETELYASKLASSSSFFSDVVNNEMISNLDSVSEGSEFLKGPLLTTTIAFGVIAGSILIILFGFSAYFTFREPYQKRCRNHRPIAEIWPSFSSWNSSKLSLSKQYTLPESPFPCSIIVSSQDSFSTLSNHGIFIGNSDSYSIEENEVVDTKNWENPLHSMLGYTKPKSIIGTELKTQITNREKFCTEENDHTRLHTDIISIDSSSNEPENKLSIV